MTRPPDHPASEPTSPVTAGSERLRALIDRIAQGASQRDLERIHPHEQIAALRAEKLGALRLRTTDGGGGATLRELFATVIALGAADSNVAHILRNHFVFIERIARTPRTAEHVQWQRLAAQGVVFGLANTDAPRSPRPSVLRKAGPSYVLDGIKHYSTGCLYADHIVVRTVDEERRSLTVIVPADRAGITRVDDWDGAGQRLTGTGTTVFESVAVAPHEFILDEPGQAYSRPHESTLAQLFLTAINAGIIRAVLADTVQLVQGRGRNFYHGAGDRPADDSLIQQVAGNLSSAAFAAECVVLAAADVQDRIGAAREQGLPSEDLLREGALLAAKAKVIVDDLAIRSASSIYDAGGASSTIRSTNLDRHWRNARTLASHNPTAYKARSIGQLEINGTPLPTGSFF